MEAKKRLLVLLGLEDNVKIMARLSMVISSESLEPNSTVECRMERRLGGSHWAGIRRARLRCVRRGAGRTPLARLQGASNTRNASKPTNESAMHRWTSKYSNVEIDEREREWQKANAPWAHSACNMHQVKIQRHRGIEQYPPISGRGALATKLWYVVVWKIPTILFMKGKPRKKS